MGNIKTLTSMALIYTLTASVKHNLFSTTKRSSDFNHTMGVIGIMGYTLIDGASQIQGVLTHCNALRDGRTWCTDPDFVYHSIKAVSGTALFYILFGAGDDIAITLVRWFEVRG
jgi:hypothetical protein